MATAKIASKGAKKKTGRSKDGFAIYQTRTAETIHGKYRDQKGQIASMLGLVSEAGSILDSYKRYLRDEIDLDHNCDYLRIELGDLLWYFAVVATACELEISVIARENLAEAAKQYDARLPCIIESESIASSEIVEAFAGYQREASKHCHLNLGGPQGLLAPLCGLAAAVGSILTFPRDQPGIFVLAENQPFFLKELGDLLWYISAVATAAGLNLGDIAQENLVRARDLYPVSTTNIEKLLESVPKIGISKKATENFPRVLVIRFDEQSTSDGPTATQTIVSANPNAFPRGPIPVPGAKSQGFKIGAPLGNRTNDNARRADGYRYHDAIHMAFMAVIGWSATMRDLLRVKRKSQRATDREEDSARIIFLEEGIAATLARLAPLRMHFLGENSVDGETIATIKALIQDTEVEGVPGWLWRRAICQGFIAMHELDKNKGGYLIADLDRRQLSYSKMDPSNVTAKNSNKSAARAKR